jgi:RimJ/RimL family protein N-acetyltransferase
MSPTFPDVVLRSNRLTLRPLRQSDVEAVVRACSDPLTQAWLPLPSPYSAELAESFCLTLAPELRSSGRGLIRGIEVAGRLAGCIDLKRTDWKSRVTESDGGSRCHLRCSRVSVIKLARPAPRTLPA